MKSTTYITISLFTSTMHFLPSYMTMIAFSTTVFITRLGRPMSLTRDLGFYKFLLSQGKSPASCSHPYIYESAAFMIHTSWWACQLTRRSEVYDTWRAETFRYLRCAVLECLSDYMCREVHFKCMLIARQAAFCHATIDHDEQDLHFGLTDWETSAAEASSMIMTCAKGVSTFRTGHC